MKTDTGYVMPPAWRIEGKATAFSPWMVIRTEHRLERAVAEADRMKTAHTYYTTRVRAN